VATHEIKFGDNDRLAALVAVLVDADALVLLSDVDALYDMPPSKPGAKRIDKVEFGSDLAEVEIGGSSTQVGTGGAVTKVSAARVATEQGIAVLLTNTDQVSLALDGAEVGTWFEAKSSS
jgi:glutamate 5-kinase